jgi:hypothetical protein
MSRRRASFARASLEATPVGKSPVTPRASFEHTANGCINESAKRTARSALTSFRPCSMSHRCCLDTRSRLANAARLPPGSPAAQRALNQRQRPVQVSQAFACTAFSRHAQASRCAPTRQRHAFGSALFFATGDAVARRTGLRAGAEPEFRAAGAGVRDGPELYASERSEFLPLLASAARLAAHAALLLTLYGEID